MSDHHVPSQIVHAYNKMEGGAMPPNPNIPAQHPGIWETLLGAAVPAVVNAVMGGDDKGEGSSAVETTAPITGFTPGVDVGPPQQTSSNGLRHGHGHPHPHGLVHRRRRRRKLLTASDKADIAFLRGTLGGGELGRAAISAVLSRRSS